MPHRCRWCTVGAMACIRVQAVESPFDAPRIALLGVDLLARLLGISAVSARRYSSGAGPIPDAVAARLRALALMVGDLGGAYNDTGIRRWFTRPRTALENRAPVDVLTPGWQPDDPAPRQVRSLARALTASPAT